ncbi:MAG: peptidylprolyl isomerase [Patescibacteria group bacterium]|jgi:hypothetical protein|nr:peptidylprolyl isomerase [Patescibacteria group bacterium]
MLLPNQKENIQDAEIDHLRAAVLKWVDAKKTNTKIQTTKLSPTPRPPMSSPFRHNAKIKYIVIALAVGIPLVFIAFGFSLCYFKWSNPIISKITKIIPYPVAIVDYQPLPYYEWQNQIATLTNFYQREKIKNPDMAVPTILEIQRHIMERMIDRKIMDQISNSYQIEVTSQDIDQQTQKLIDEVGSSQGLEQQINELYGWNITEFQNEIIKPLLLKDKLSRVVATDDNLNQQAKKTIEAVITKLQAGVNFETVAQQYSEDITGVQGGDLGYFSIGQMTEEFEQAAFNLEPGEISPIIKTKFGYHVIKVEEKLMDDSGDVSQIRARHILIRGKDLDGYINELKNTKKIWRLARL